MTNSLIEGHVAVRTGVTWEQVTATVRDNALFPPEASFVLLERTEGLRFGTRAEAEGWLSEPWPTGRVFTDGCEVQWEAVGDGYVLRLLTEGDLPDGWPEAGCYEVGGEMKLLLFGERTAREDHWRETRIPQRLRYPVGEKTGRVRLVAVPYRRGGMTVRLRLKGVE